MLSTILTILLWQTVVHTGQVTFYTYGCKACFGQGLAAEFGSAQYLGAAGTITIDGQKIIRGLPANRYVTLTSQ